MYMIRKLLPNILIPVILTGIHVTLTQELPSIGTYRKEDTPEEVTDFSDYQFEILAHETIEIRAAESDVTYHFYSQNGTPDVAIKHNNLHLLNKTHFCICKYTIFIIHGWKGDRASSFNYYVKEALLKKHNINLFVVDWSPVAKRNYLTAKLSVLDVGRFVATFIKSLVSQYDLDLSKLAFVAHSLGAHIAGNAGAALNGQVDYIVGLDPASPLFTKGNLDNRLDRTDAKFVQIIHTNGGYLGVRNPAGHSDYFPNGGCAQPGCGYDFFKRCSHARAWKFYVESVTSDGNLFVSRRCCSYGRYASGFCNDNNVSFMAGYPIDFKYLAKVNANSPPPHHIGPRTCDMFTVYLLLITSLKEP
ncbi:hypothetical protein NQ317_009274 [Molorchus minor]|uniref:Lipase domain-containing protein n=1 Tax=Molorchus minor TaxID=1323400 RepID=A0ABQ9JYC8_9CUCU|nr:hypothetical protein NQ317_009274 [Molorchus minor]